MEASSPFTFALIGLAVGFVIGLVCYRLFSKGARDVASLKQTLLKREHQIADLKKNMSSHLTGIQQRLENIRHEADHLEQHIEDEAKQIDPDSICGRDLDDVKPGGLGVHIIKEVMDVAEYQQRDPVGMRLTMVKQLQNTEAQHTHG